MATRIQLQRTKGWRMPPGAVKVDRSTRWGNPFRVGDTVHKGPSFSGRDETVRDAEHACRLFRAHLFNLRSAADLATLRGRDLACWCKPDAPCHADVLIELANS